MASWKRSSPHGRGLTVAAARKHLRLVAGFVIVLIITFALLFCRSHPTISQTSSLPQHVYVWQRSWSPAVKSAVRQRGPEFAEVAVLVAEVTWKNGEGKAAHVKVDTDALRATERPVGIALRVNPFDGPKSTNPFDPAGPQTKFIADTAADVVERIKRDSIGPAELQVDFDCPESKLSGYRNWVVAIRERIKPTPLAITTLPSLLGSPDFEDLVRECNSYVLQVHSIKRPASPSEIEPLCDAAQSRQWVEAASRIGVPFRVALPTYAYVAEFDASGKCTRLAQEGSSRRIPPGGTSREIRADAAAISALVREWNTNRPTGMVGVIWYRMPNDDDELNWRWTTLASVMQGRTPPANDAQVNVAPLLENH